MPMVWFLKEDLFLDSEEFLFSIYCALAQPLDTFMAKNENA